MLPNEIEAHVRFHEQALAFFECFYAENRWAELMGVEQDPLPEDWSDPVVAKWLKDRGYTACMIPVEEHAHLLEAMRQRSVLSCDMSIQFQSAVAALSACGSEVKTKQIQPLQIDDDDLEDLSEEESLKLMGDFFDEWD